MLLLNADETAAMIDRDDLRDAVARVMVEVSAGRLSMPPRIGAWNDDPRGVMAVMPAHVPALGAMATKLVTVFPSNAAKGLPTHQGAVLVVDPDTGSIEAMLDGDVVTAERTAAASAVAADHLARPDATVLAVIGTGVQAHSHLHHVSRVRDVTEVRVAGRRPDVATALAARVAAEGGPDVLAVESIEAACRGADIVCLTTDAGAPVIDRTWLAPGTHVSSVGFHATGRELDTATVVDARLVVESRESAFAPYPVGSHDLAIPLAEGAITAEHVAAEIGEIVAGDAVGRTHADELTLYKSVGVAAQDVAAAQLVVDRARAEGVGTQFTR